MTKHFLSNLFISLAMLALTTSALAQQSPSVTDTEVPSETSHEQEVEHADISYSLMEFPESVPVAILEADARKLMENKHETLTLQSHAFPKMQTTRATHEAADLDEANPEPVATNTQERPTTVPLPGEVLEVYRDIADEHVADVADMSLHGDGNVYDVLSQRLLYGGDFHHTPWTLPQWDEICPTADMHVWTQQ